jgi:hypothetical protein
LSVALQQFVQRVLASPDRRAPAAAARGLVVVDLVVDEENSVWGNPLVAGHPGKHPRISGVYRSPAHRREEWSTSEKLTINYNGAFLYFCSLRDRSGSTTVKLRFWI